MKYDVISVGGAVIDVFLETEVGEVKGNLAIPVGQKILVSDLEFSTGGGGLNTSAAFSKMGLKTGFVGKLGKDENAKLILEDLKKFEVDFLGSYCNEPTGYATIIDSKKQNRSILAYKGANNYLKFGDLSLGKLKTDWFYFSSSVGETLKTQEKLARFAREKGILVAYNPSSYLTKQGARVLKNLLKVVNVLILNDVEAKHLVPRGDLFRGLHSFGPRIVCVTFGAHGSKVSFDGKIYFSKARKVKVVEKTGAGDAFAAGFVSGLIKTGDVQKAARIGILNAESVIQKLGAKNGLLGWRDVGSKIR